MTAAVAAPRIAFVVFATSKSTLGRGYALVPTTETLGAVRSLTYEEWLFS